MAETRRRFLASAAAGSSLLMTGCDLAHKLSGRVNEQHPPASAEPSTPADVTLRIGSVVVDIAKDHAISTIGYNGSAPGPLIRLREGVAATVEIVNRTDSPEFVEWHGMNVPAEVDGAEEENSMAVPAHGSIRYSLVPQPPGLRYVHSNDRCMSDLSRGTYSGQFGLVYVEPRSNQGNYDQEIFLVSHEWEPFFTARKDAKANGWEIGYQKFTINGKCLGHGEPVSVKQGQRVLFHIANASATETIKLALSGHRFLVMGLDGNPVPKPQLVEVLELGAAERVDALVEMTNPGVWVLGTPDDDDRKNGMGIVVEYAGKTGAPLWTAPAKKPFDYAIFGDLRPPESPDEVIPLTFGKINGGAGGFNLWTVNGKSFEEKDNPHTLHRDHRYRLSFDNQTDDAHPVHLHRSSFEIVSINGRPTGGILKDVLLLKGLGKAEVDFVPSIAGLSLFHCHQQLQMDFGFKQLFNVI